MKPLLILLQPIDPLTNLRVDVRVASVATPVAAGMGGFTWEGAVSRRPRFMQDLMSPKLDGKILTGRGDFMVNLGHIINLAVDPRSLNWSGAPVTVWDATALDYANMPIEFTGIVSNAQLDIWTGQLIVNLEVDVGRLDRPLLTGEFTGGGGLLGDADKRGVLWPAGFGYNENCEPVWFDLVNNVGMLDGFANLTTVHGLFEGGDDRGASFGNYASYALLVAAAIPPGRWATCLTAGLVRLGAPPVGRISCDCTFRGAAGTGANLTGALIRRILETHAGIATGSIDTVSLAAIDVALPYLVHYWTKEQRGVKDLVEALASAINAQCLILLNGQISATRAFGGTNIGTVNRTSTSAPAVTDWQLAQQEEPVWRMRARTGRPGSVFSFDEILYADNLIDMGAFNIATVYRQGNLVWMPNGSQFLFINATPSSGHTPPSPATSDAWWQRTKAPTTAADLVYGDGSTIESLKPGMAGATRNIIYRQGTDPVLAVTVYDGDIWTDTSAGIDVTKVRQGGVWQISGTPNFITYSASAPGSPVNGAIWVDTSVTPNVVRVRVGAVWQIASNLVTQGTDIGVSNGAGTTVTIVPVDPATIQAIGNSVRCIGAGGAWNAGWNTTDALTAGAFVQFTNVAVSGTSVYMLGLTDTPITNATNNFNQISYAAYVNATALNAYVNGVSRALTATVAAGDVVSIAYDNISIRLYKTTVAGVTTLLDTFPTTAGRRFVCCGTFLYTTPSTFGATGIRFDPFSNQNWGDTGGAHRPADDAGTSGVLTAIGSFTNIVGNSTYKLGGTHGAFQGGAVGQAQFGTAYVTSSIIYGSIGGGWITTLQLDDDATTIAGAGSASINYEFRLNPTTGGAYTWALYAGATSPASGSGTGLTVNSRAALIYDGVNVYAVVDGVVKGQASNVAAGQTLYPKIIDFYVNTSIEPIRDILYGPWSENAWSRLGGPGKPADNATADLTLATGTYSTATHQFVGNSVTRTSATAFQWDSYASSKESYRFNCSLTFVLPSLSSDTMCGLTSLPQGYAADWRYQYFAINFALYCASGTTWQVYESGSLAENFGTSKNGVTFSATTVWRIDYDGVNVRYYADGVLMRTSAATSGLTLYVAATLFHLASTVTRIGFTTFTDNNWTSIPNGPANVFALGGTEDIRNTLMTATVDTGGTGGRARVGLLTNGISTGGPAVLPTIVQNVDQEWTDVQNAAGKRPSDNAGTTVTVVAVTPSDSQVIGNSVYRKVGPSAWNRGFTVREAQTNGIVLKWTHFSASADYMMGLGSAPITDATNNYTQPLIALRPIGASLFVYMSGAIQNGGVSIGTVTVGDIYTITYDNLNYLVYRTTSAGVTALLATYSATGGLTHYAVGTISDATSGVVISNIQVAPFMDRYLDNMADGASYARLPVASSTGTGTSRRALIDFTQGHSNKTLDNVGDGSTYARPLAAELTSGVPKLSVVGSGKKLGDVRNMQNITTLNLGYKWTSAISYTAAAGTPATATISVAAGGFTSGSYAPSYNAMSANVTGTGGTTVTYFLYVNDPTNAAGAQTLVVTTTALNVYSGDGYLYVGTCDVFFPTSGTGGGGGGGGGGTCPLADAWVDTMRGPVRARDVIPEVDWILCETLDRRGMEWVLCESNRLAWEYGGRIIAENGREVTVSSSTPILPRGHERLMPVVDLDCQELSVPAGAVLDWSPCRYVPEPEILEVAMLKVQNRIYSAGNIAGQSIMTHNPNPKP